MSTKKRPESPEDIALWRLAILGPLVSARLEHGDRRTHFKSAAEREYEKPDGERVHVSARTIEDWYYAYLEGGWKALMPAAREDRGTSRAIRPELAAKLLAAKRQKPRRSIGRLIKCFVRLRWAAPDELKRSTVHRLLQANALSLRPPRAHDHERRSFLPEHASDLWVGDVMHGPVVWLPCGGRGKSYLITLMDAATRFVVRSRFCVDEGMLSHESVLLAAIEQHGLPRAYYVDRGAAYVADSLRTICADLGVQLIHTKARDPEAKGVIERWHRMVRDELLDELPAEPLTLDDLNAALWAWLGVEYHARTHSTTGRAPGLHFESELAYLRPVPEDISLRDVFLHRALRLVRKDGCVRLDGAFYEVPGDLVGEYVELRHDPRRPEDLPLVFHRGAYRDVARPLDRHANASGRRRPRTGDEARDDLDIDAVGLLADEYYRTLHGAPRRRGDDGDDGGAA
jgi:transposase InsO family protein